MRIGITGSIGSGKSTALALFKEFHFEVIDSDQIVKNLLNHEPNIHHALKDHFGPKIFNNNTLDRQALADIVFKNKTELLWLEDLLHPLVIEYIQNAIKHDPQAHWAIEIPLLFEKNLQSLFDFTLCLSVDPDVQKKRLLARGLSLEQLQRRLSHQMLQAEKEALADFTIPNNSTIPSLREQILALIKKLLPQP